MTVTNTVTETEHLTPLRSAVEHINWNTLYQQKMALEEVSDMLYAKRKEDDTFGKDSQDNGAPLAFASFCDDYPNREWTVFHI